MSNFNALNNQLFQPVLFQLWFFCFSYSCDFSVNSYGYCFSVSVSISVRYFAWNLHKCVKVEYKITNHYTCITVLMNLKY